MANKRVKVEWICRHCGLKKQVAPTWARDHKFCNRECNRAWYASKPNMQEYTCLECGNVRKSNNGRKFCTRACYHAYVGHSRNALREQRYIDEYTVNMKREFSDMTLTLVASAELKGLSLDKEVVDECKWDKERFYQQLTLHRKHVEIRKDSIIRQCKTPINLDRLLSGWQPDKIENMDFTHGN